MSGEQAAGGGAARPSASASGMAAPWPAAQEWQEPDARRWLQLALATVWLLDAVLQYQAFMFTRGFGRMLAGTAAGNPAVIAGPIMWAARIIEQRPGVTDATMATIQLLIGLGIAWRPSVKIALAASIGWSAAVWWLGEGLGGIFAGTASPLTGAPGAVIIYALLAVLLWPTDRAGEPAPFPAARAVGAPVARLLWLVLWGGLAWLAAGPAASRSAQGMHDTISAMTAGEPGWLVSVGNGVATLLARQGLAAAIVLAGVLAAIAVGILLPPRAVRAVVVLAVATAAVIWAVGEDFGAIFTGSATDPNSGLLLGLLAAAYWPARPAPSGNGTGDRTLR